MSKLPNLRMSLDAVVLQEGRMLGEAELVAVSDLTNPSAVDQKGVPWRDHVLKDYRVQKAASAGSTISEKSILAPHWAIDILKSSDPDDDNYSVMYVAVPSEKHTHGIEAIGIIRPDVVKFGDGQPYVKLWFNALVDPRFDTARLTSYGQPSLSEVLMEAAMERVAPLVGKDPLIFTDDQSSLTVDKLVSQYGFKILLEGLAVSSLPEKRKAQMDRATNHVNILVRPDAASKEGIIPTKATEMVIDYLVNGYEANPNGILVKRAVAQLRAQTSEGLVQYV